MKLKMSNACVQAYMIDLLKLRYQLKELQEDAVLFVLVDKRFELGQGGIK